MQTNLPLRSCANCGHIRAEHTSGRGKCSAANCGCPKFTTEKVETFKGAPSKKDAGKRLAPKEKPTALKVRTGTETVIAPSIGSRVRHLKAPKKSFEVVEIIDNENVMVREVGVADAKPLKSLTKNLWFMPEVEPAATDVAEPAAAPAVTEERGSAPAAKKVKATGKKAAAKAPARAKAAPKAKKAPKAAKPAKKAPKAAKPAKKAATVTGRGKLTPELREQILDLRKREPKMSYVNLGKAVGVSDASIRRVLGVLND
jgi:hypothetical protein